MEELVRKIIVPVSEIQRLTQTELEDGIKQYVRYRIISEDRNRTSSWSPLVEFSLDEAGLNVLDGGAP
jgi:hypothetical protein